MPEFEGTDPIAAYIPDKPARKRLVIIIGGPDSAGRFEVRTGDKTFWAP